MWKPWIYSLAWLPLFASVAHAQMLLSEGSAETSRDPFSLLAFQSPEPGDIGAEPTTDPETAHAFWAASLDDSENIATSVRPVAMMQLDLQPPQLNMTGLQGPSGDQYAGSFESRQGGISIGWDTYSAPEFEGGLIVFGRDVAMKLGGYVKADFIYDFDPIDSTDAFIPTEIPVGAPDRTNARMHARQTRLSFDTRWKTNGRVAQLFVEGDFFGSDNHFRLRHAYGEVGRLLVGQTWTTFTHIVAAPATLDFEGSVSNVNRRQAQIRWRQPILGDSLIFAVSAEDTEFIIIPPPAVPGEARTPAADLIARLKLVQDWGQFQGAYLYRRGGFQPDGDDVLTGSGWGFNFTGVVLLVDSTKAYYQILFGEGIGSYRSLPDAAPISATEDALLPIFGWMVGVTHEWSDTLSSNFTFAENSVENTPLQAADDITETTYLAANLIWQPLDRVYVGIEYLYGIRQNFNRSQADAHRIQTAVGFALP